MPVATRRNIPMFLYRQRLGLTQAVAAIRAGITQRDWSALECMNFPHFRHSSAFVALLLEVDEKTIVPLQPHDVEEIVFTDLDRATRRRVEANLVSRDEQSHPLYRSNLIELTSRLDDVLRTLTYREREILKLRYGFGDGYTYTLEEVGKIFHVTRERVRDVEAKAIRKLQYPVRARKLEGFVDPPKNWPKPQIIVRYGRPTSHEARELGLRSHEARELGLRWKATLVNDPRYSQWGRNGEEVLTGILELLSKNGKSGEQGAYSISIKRRNR